MGFLVEINCSGAEMIQRQLNDGPNVLGRSDQCQIRFNHAELEPQALHIDVRGDDVWIQNLNPYTIYVGEEGVEPNAWTNWRTNAATQLTKSISVQLNEIKQPAAEIDGSGPTEAYESKGLDVSKVVQIALIAVCFLFAPVILFSGNGEGVSATEELSFDLDETLDELNRDIANPEILKIRNRLQIAWIEDQRWDGISFENQRVVNAYERLNRCRLMDAKILERASLKSSTKEAIEAISSLTQTRLAKLTK